MQILTQKTQFNRLGSLFTKNQNTTKFIRNEYSTILCNKQSLIKKNEKTNKIQLINPCLNSYTFKPIDTKSFASLAWFGLWGKTPEKQLDTTANVASDNFLIPPTPETPQAPQTTGDVDLSAGYIPEPPPIADDSVILNALGEPTLSSLGLASNWTPVGWIQSLLEVFHADIGLPWFQAVALFALVLRTFLLPVNIKAQKNSVKMRKIAPEMAQLNEKLNDAKMTGNTLEVARCTHEYVQFMKMNNIGFGSMFVPMIQFPFVISTFIAIRKMCNLPVESMQTGGALWFTDLTLADPYYILPVVATASILAIVHRGVDTGMSSANMSPTMRGVIYGVSAISFPFFLFMPSGVMAYVCTTNFISLFLSYFLSIDGIKKLFGIPILTEMDKLKIKESQKRSKNFIAGFKESMQNQKIIAEVRERENLREKQFSQAGTRVPIKTFKENPKANKKDHF